MLPAILQLLDGLLCNYVDVPQGVGCRLGGRVGSIPSSSSARVHVSLGKILNPKLLPMAAPMLYEWINV